MKFCEYNGTMHVTEIDDLDGIIIPNVYEGMPVTDVCSFEGSKIKTVKLPNDLRELNQRMFYDCRFLEEIVIPDGITVIPADCFNGCCSLRKVTLPSSVVVIESRAFGGCINLKQIDLTNVKELGDHAFSESGLEKVELKCIEVIKAEAFQRCKKLKSASIEGDITSLSGMAFNMCSSLEEVNLSDNIRRIGMKCFGKCFNLKQINKPQNLQFCSSSAFYLCSSLDTHLLDCFDSCKTSELSFDFGGK